MGKVLTVAIGKGGEGKTTTAVTLAFYLAIKQGRKVCLVDLDGSCNATGNLPGVVQQENRRYSLLDAVLETAPLREAVIQTEVENLSVIPSKSNMKNFSKVVSANGVSVTQEFAIDDILKESGIRDVFDYIVMDAPPSLDLVTTSALTASDFFLSPMKCSPYSQKGLDDLLQAYMIIKAKLNPALTSLGVFLNCFRPNLKLDSTFKDEIRRRLSSAQYIPLPFIEVSVRESVRVREASLFKKPVFDYERANNPAAWDYEALCEYVVGRIERHPSAGNPELSHLATTCPPSESIPIP